MENIFIGDKFYREKEDGSLEIIRITKQQNDLKYNAKDEAGNKFKILKKDIQENYTRLIPDGYVTFCIVSLEKDYKDVIVTLHRQKDIDNNVELPFAVCRQSIFDIFANQILKSNIRYVGTSMNVDNCPQDTDFRILLSCNKLDFCFRVSIYRDDTFNDFFDLLQFKSKFNNTLEYIANTFKDNKQFVGYYPTIKQLLIENDFMFDFYKAFNINKVNFKLLPNNDFSLDNRQVPIIEDMVKAKISNTYVLKYDYEIDLDNIQRDYILISDIDNDMYVVGYDKGEYVNYSYDKNVKDKLEVKSLLKYTKRTSY